MSTDWYLVAPNEKQVLSIGGKSPAGALLHARKATGGRDGPPPASLLTGAYAAEYGGYELVVYYLGTNPRPVLTLAVEEYYRDLCRDLDASWFLPYVDAWLAKYGNDPELYLVPDTGDAYMLTKAWPDYLTIRAPRAREGFTYDSIYEGEREYWAEEAGKK